MKLKNQIARVVARYRGKYRVRSGLKEFWAEITGKLSFTAITPEDYPIVGDLVRITELETGHAAIQEILPRKTVLKRKAAGKSEIQPIAANIDVAFIVQSVDRDFNLNRLERYLTIINAGRVKPIIILNKTDLISKPELEEKIAQVKNRFENLPVFATSTVEESGIQVLHEAIKRNRIYCFVGSSGVGKSSIINKLLGHELLQTKEISTSTKKGRHATTHRELFILKNGGMVIDNPGLREVGIADAEQAVAQVFEDISTLAKNCKYTDCTHLHEPGCAVLEALHSGQLNKNQYSNYLKLKKETEYYNMSSLEKRWKDRRFGHMVNNIKKQMKKLK
jgi:ribosome biogenesis GTPase